MLTMQGEQSIYDKIKANLSHGQKAKIARKHNVTRAAVTQVANGEYENLEILKDLIEAATLRKQLKEEVDSKAKSL